MRDLESAAGAHLDDLCRLRRDLHAWPEPGFEEVRTAAAVREQLGALGLSPRSCAGTGVVADIGEGDRVIALRADMDCLRMSEANTGLPWRSTRPGLAHMCGHDGHTAALVGAARLLASVSRDLPGRVRLLFQPAEEGPGGAPRMIDDGCLDGVGEVYGMHNWPGAPLGTLRTIAGPCMAHVARFRVVVRGLGGHASQPQVCIDPVLAAAQIVTALQSIVARSVHYRDSAVVSATMVHGGEVFNVIPDTVEVGGTIRVLRDEVWDVVERRFREVVEGTARAAGARADVELERMYPALVNTPAETEAVMRVGRELFGPDAVGSEDLPMLGAEDFAYYLRHRPGCFFFLGAAEAHRGNAMCHATEYDFNDALLGPAIGFWVRLVEDRLGARLFT